MKNTATDNIRDKRNLKINFQEAIKIGFGAAFAVFICTLTGLPHPASAGTITLLTLMVSTRKQTMALISRRLISFCITVFLCWVIFPRFSQPFVAYGLYLFLIVFILWTIGWKETLSVNAVIGTTFLLDQNFSLTHIGLELCVLLIGITIAFVLNLYQPDRTIADLVYEQICKVEMEIMRALNEFAQAISGTKQVDEPARTLAQILDDTKKGMDLINQYNQNKLSEKDRWILPYIELGFAQYSLLHVLTTQIEIHPVCINQTCALMDHIESAAWTVIDSKTPESWLEENKAIIEQVEQNSEGRFDSKTQGVLLMVLYNLREFVQLKQNYLNRLSNQEKEEFMNRHHEQLGKYSRQMHQAELYFEKNYPER